MEYILIKAVNWFADILVLLLVLRALLSWFVRDRFSMIGKFYEMTISLTEPIVEPIRRVMSRFNTGMLDFSVLIAFFCIRIIASLVIMLITIIF